MSIDNATFVVQRGDEKFSCQGSDLKGKLLADDLLIAQQDDDYVKVSGNRLRSGNVPEKDLPLCSCTYSGLNNDKGVERLFNGGLTTACEGSEFRLEWPSGIISGSKIEIYIDRTGASGASELTLNGTFSTTPSSGWFDITWAAGITDLISILSIESGALFKSAINAIRVDGSILTCDPGNCDKIDQCLFIVTVEPPKCVAAHATHEWDMNEPIISPVETLWDGDLTTTPKTTMHNYLTVSFPEGVLEGHVRLYMRGEIKLNGQSYVKGDASDAEWFDLGGSASVTSLSWYVGHPYATNGSLYAIELDGQICLSSHCPGDGEAIHKSVTGAELKALVAPDTIWEDNSISISGMTDMRFKGNRLMACSQDGVWYSEDEGDTFTKVGNISGLGKTFKFSDCPELGWVYLQGKDRGASTTDGKYWTSAFADGC